MVDALEAERSATTKKALRGDDAFVCEPEIAQPDSKQRQSGQQSPDEPTP